jgi:hypothetical protein
LGSLGALSGSLGLSRVAPWDLLRQDPDKYPKKAAPAQFSGTVLDPKIGPNFVRKLSNKWIKY